MGPENPHGLAIVQRATPLRTEEEGKQDYDWATQRGLEGRQRGRRATGFGMPVAYKLVPGGAFPPMFDPSTPRPRAGPGDRALALGDAVRRG